MSHKSLIWNTVPEYIFKNKNFLLNHTDLNKKFNSSDNSKSYKENLKKAKDDWYYKTHDVVYTQNKHGYRTEDFKNIDWANSVVIFGCSIVFGVGVTDEDTLSTQLSKIINRPVINMGIPGTGPLFSMYNSILLNEFYPTPKAVLQIWSDPNRTVYFKKRRIEEFGIWDIEKNSYGEAWIRDPTHGTMNLLFASMINKQIFASKTKYHEATFFTEAQKALNCDLLSTIDYARDSLHPGRETFKNIAENLAKDLDL